MRKLLNSVKFAFKIADFKIVDFEPKFGNFLGAV